MKKLYSIISIFIVFLSFANGQSKSESNKQCNIFKQIVELVSDDKLNTIEGSEFVPKYFKVFSWNKCYTATVKIPTAQEIVIFQESNKNKYSCILNDYGADEAKAKEDLKKIVKIFSDCLNVKDVKITNQPFSTRKDNTFCNFFYQHCRIQISTFQSGITQTWVTLIDLENTTDH